MADINKTKQVLPLQINAIAKIQAASEEKKPRTFSMTAYTGVPMRINGWYYPVIVALDGINIESQKRPAFINHITFSNEFLLGQTNKITKTKDDLTAYGIVTGQSPEVMGVLAHADNGFEWQASIGATPDEMEFIKEGSKVKVNGQEFTGPLNVAWKSTLKEISVVALGGDNNTSTKIAANDCYELKLLGVQIMAKEANTEDVRTDIEASGQPKKPETKIDAPTPDMSAVNAAYAANLERIAAINGVCGTGHADIAAKAIRENWAPEKAELEVLRASTPKVSGIVMQNKEATPSVLEAATMLAGGIPADECAKRYGDKSVEAAQKQFRYGIGLQQLLMEAAWSNGSHIRSFREDPRGVLQAAFSTSSLAGILSNVANKFLLAGFTGVEQTWRKISRIRPCSDFKTITSYRLNGSFNYDEVGAGGELKHAELGEESYTNQAKTYGKIVGITRQDIINDDLGALTAVPQKLGRGAGLKFNNVFWSAFQATSPAAAFFHTANHANYVVGAATPLGLDSLTAIVTYFKQMKDAKGIYTGLEPAILLVPVDIEGVANSIYQSQLLIAVGTTGTAAKYPNQNIHVGKYEVAPSRYLSDSSITGYSTTAWYLLANPMDAAAMEVLFLNGREQPTVEQADADFDTLGIQMRGYHDFGCALAEWQSGVKVKGAA
ncbi:MAG: phage major capsid protein [Sedimentisphaerales bacterium]